MRAATVAILLVAICGAFGGRARAGELDALGAEDVGEVTRAVAAISARPAREASPDVVFAAARACEDRLLDPGRAAVLYERIVRAYPSARVSVAAARRLAALREILGAHDEAAVPAAALAYLIAHADDLPAVDVYARAVALSTAAWPGAPATTLWLADWLRRSERCPLARVHYARVVARWPGTADANAAVRGATGCALDGHDWAAAEALAHELPAVEPADRAVRDDLLHLAARGRLRARGYLAAWLVVIAVGITFAAGLAASVRRAGRGVLRPPIEVIYLAPIAAVLIGVALTAHRAIAPAVATISIGGLALAYLSGAQLEASRGRARTWRGLGHLALCLVAVAALVYIAFTRDDLIDLLIETVRFGPDA